MAETMNIYQKMQAVKCELQKSVDSKSGKNNFAKFSYLQLTDFLPKLNELNTKYGLFTQFQIITSYNPDGVKIEKAVLKIVDTDDTSKGLVYESETADAIVKGATAIQNLGSLHTYMRRYLYVEAYDLAEEDDLDKRSGMKQGEEGSLVADNGKRLASKAQVAILKKGDSERVAKMMEYYKVQRLEDLTVAQASQAIEQLKKPVKTEEESC